MQSIINSIIKYRNLIIYLFLLLFSFNYLYNNSALHYTKIGNISIGIAGFSAKKINNIKSYFNLIRENKLLKQENLILKQNELNDELFTQQRVIDSQVLKIHELDDELYTQQHVIDTQNLKIDKLSNRDTAGTATQCLINIRKLYETHNIKEDCPVCYEVIKPSALMMPACGHIICKSCMVHCKDKCPICRVCYNRYDKHIRI